MTIEKRIVEAPYMTSALRREAAEEITRLRNALAQSVKIGAEHRDGRLKALEWVAALESRLREAMAQIETMTDMRHNPGLTALQFLAHPMRGVAERAIHRKAIQDREFARALAEFAVDVDEDNIKAARNE